MSRKFENAYRHLRRVLWSGNPAFLSAPRLFSRIHRGSRGNSRRRTFTRKAPLNRRFCYEDRSCSFTNYPVTIAQEILWNKEKQMNIQKSAAKKRRFFIQPSCSLFYHFLLKPGAFHVIIIGIKQKVWCYYERRFSSHFKI